MIKNIVFISNEIREKSYVICIYILLLRNGNFFDVVIELDNNIFDYRLLSSFVFFFWGNKILLIWWLIFRNCICLYWEKWLLLNGFFYEIVIGVLLILINFDKLL